MSRFIRPARPLAAAVAAVFGALVFASCHSATPSSSATCSLNSDCDLPLVCVFSKCHEQCESSEDCAAGERCVPSGNGPAALYVCQLPAENACGSGGVCNADLVCTPTDMQCRAPCQTNGDCTRGQYCVASGGVSVCYQTNDTSDESTLVQVGAIAPDGAVLTSAGSDASFYASVDGAAEGGYGGGPDATVEGGPLDGGGGSDAAMADGSGGADGSAPEGGASDSGSTGVKCPSAQTQFGQVAVGDANPSFTSGVGLRTATQMLVFSGESEGADGGDDAGTENSVWVQAFDAVSGASAGPAQQVFSAPGPGAIQVMGAAIDPDGDVVVIASFAAVVASNVAGCPNGWNAAPYSYGVSYYQQGGLVAAFLTPSADAGPAGLTMHQLSNIESAITYGQPHVIWQPAVQSFVATWEYCSGGTAYTKLRKYLANGSSAGGGLDILPTSGGNSAVAPDNVEQASVAASGASVGVAYEIYNYIDEMELSVVDSMGNEIGTPADVYPRQNSWLTLGGLSDGFEVIHPVSGGGIGGAFLPLAADAGVVAPVDGGTFSSFTYPGAAVAIDGRAVSDDTGGAGGIGLAVLYSDGVSFAYVNADGTARGQPSNVITHTYNGPSTPGDPGDLLHISQFGGSFVVSDYSNTEHLTRLVASGCQ